MFRYTCLMFWGVPAYSWPPSAEVEGGLSGAPGSPPPGGGRPERAPNVGKSRQVEQIGSGRVRQHTVARVPAEPGCFAAARGWETLKASFCPLASMIWQISGDY